MRAVLLESVAVAVGVALMSRLSEWSFTRYCPQCGETIQNVVGMMIAGVTAGLLFFLWRRQSTKRSMLMVERQRAIVHIHHHLRNSLQIITYRSNDPVIREQIERILAEIESALPRTRQKS